MRGIYCWLFGHAWDANSDVRLKTAVMAMTGIYPIRCKRCRKATTVAELVDGVIR